MTRSQDAVSDGSPAQTAVQSQGWMGATANQCPVAARVRNLFNGKRERRGKLARRTLMIVRHDHEPAMELAFWENGRKIRVTGD